MIKLDDSLLAELGLTALPPEEKQKLLRHIYETLEKRVGTTLAMQMSEQQLKEFEQFIEQEDEAGALHWLETNFPNYKDVVAREFEIIKNEVRQAVPQILASAAQAAAMPPQAYNPVAAPGYGPYPGDPAFNPQAYPVQQQPVQAAQPLPGQYGAPMPPADMYQQRYAQQPQPMAPSQPPIAPYAPNPGYAPQVPTPPQPQTFGPAPSTQPAIAPNPSPIPQTRPDDNQSQPQAGAQPAYAQSDGIQPAQPYYPPQQPTSPQVQQPYQPQPGQTQADFDQVA